MITKEVIEARDAVIEQNIQDAMEYIERLKSEIASQEMLIAHMQAAKSTSRQIGSIVQQKT